MRALLAISATLVLFAAGCGGDDSDDSSASDTTSTARGYSSDQGAATSGDKVDIKNFAFNPADKTVKVGTKITWTNGDSAEHNVVADDGTFKSEDLEQGDTFVYTADKPGTFSYVCTYHSQMKATLTVK
ncbi:MAG: cupredoxin family copper-binding protein [Solirubrobacteraceae bacterium]